MNPAEEMQDRVRSTVRAHLSLIIVSLVAMIFAAYAFTVVGAIISAPLAIFAVNIGGVEGLLLFSAVFSLFITTVALVFLIYGFSVILGRFYRNEQAVIGYLFWGFRDFKRVGLLAVLMSVVLLLASAAVGIAAAYLIPTGEVAADAAEVLDVYSLMEPFLGYVRIILLAVVVIVLPLIVPFLFAFPILFHEKDLNLRQVLSKSRDMLKGRKLKLIFFTLKCGMYPLITCLLSFCLMYVLPDESVVASLLSLVYAVSLYYCLIYVMLSVIACYYELKDQETSCLSLPDTVPEN